MLRMMSKKFFPRMPTTVCLVCHWGQVLDSIISVDSIDVVNVEPGVQEMIVFPLPDDVRALNIAVLVGIGMLGTERPITPATFPRARFSMRGSADFSVTFE